MLSYDTPAVNGQSSAASSDMATNGLPNPTPSKPAPSSQPTPSTTTTGDAVLANGQAPAKYHHIWLVTGPAGCGKSTVAEYLATAFNLPYIEGDSFHPQANIDKMSNGIPLTDEDRWDWLTALREESLRQIAAGSEGVVLTCSALKRKYRDVIRVAGYYDHSLLLHFIYLHAPEEVLLRRVSARVNHYMGADMVHSQFNILEPPQPDEKDVISLDVSRPLEDVKKDALAQVTTTMNALKSA